MRAARVSKLYWRNKRHFWQKNEIPFIFNTVFSVDRLHQFGVKAQPFGDLLCFRHHQEITSHQIISSWLRYFSKTSVFDIRLSRLFVWEILIAFRRWEDTGWTTGKGPYFLCDTNLPRNYRVLTGSGVHTASYSMGTWVNRGHPAFYFYFSIFILFLFFFIIHNLLIVF